MADEERHGSKYPRTLCMLMACAAACATRTAAEAGDQTAGEAAVATSATLHRSTASSAMPPKPERNGLDATVVWRLEPDRLSASDGMCTNAVFEKLLPSEVRADANWLYMDVTHKGRAPEATHPGASPTIELLVDQCPARAPRASGTVWRDWATPSTLTIALADLPDGDLDLLVRAFNAEFVVPLHKEGTQMTHLVFEKRKGYSYHPGDPAKGVEPSVGLVQPTCPIAEVSP